MLGLSFFSKLHMDFDIVSIATKTVSKKTEILIRPMPAWNAFIMCRLALLILRGYVG